MKQMSYGPKSKREILESGYYFGLLFYVLNLGTYPTAYIKIPKNHKFYKKEMEEIYLDVHGGISYSKNYLWISEKEKVKGWFIGWDYAHSGDYLGYEAAMPARYRFGGKKWAIHEILKEVRAACYEIQKLGGEK